MFTLAWMTAEALQVKTPANIGKTLNHPKAA
jgi:hypothetical protein